MLKQNYSLTNCFKNKFCYYWYKKQYCLFFLTIWSYSLFVNLKNVNFFDYLLFTDDFNIFFDIFNQISWRQNLKTPINLTLFNHFTFLNKHLITYWSKLIFVGRGYQVRNWKKKNKLTFNFGHSHWTKVLLNPTMWYFNKIKYRVYLIFTYNQKNFKNFYWCVSHIKWINRYTLRGLRFKQQLFRRRFGKISQVISSIRRQ